MKPVWLAAGLLGAAVVVFTFHDLVLVFFAAVIFAVPLRAGSSVIARAFKVPSGVGLAGVIVLIGLILSAIFWLWETLIAAQVQQLVATLPASIDAIVRFASREPWASRIANALPDPSVLISGAGGVVGVLRGVAGGTLAVAVNLAILVFAAVCFAAEPRTYVGGLLRLAPPASRGRIDAVLNEAAGTIALWLRARAISMVVIGILIWAGLRLTGIPDAAALALLAAILAFVPNVGSIAAAAPALMLAAPFGWQRVAIVAILYWVAHALDDFFVIPFAERRVVRLPPALTIAAQVMLGLAGGVLGIMMAAPFVAITIVLVQRLVVEDFIESKKQKG